MNFFFKVKVNPYSSATLLIVSIEKMLYGTALAVTAVSGGSDHNLGSTFEAFYIGVGGDISLDLASSGSNIFKLFKVNI